MPPFTKIRGGSSPPCPPFVVATECNAGGQVLPFNKVNHGDSNKVTKLCDKNVDESTIIRISVYFYSLCIPIVIELAMGVVNIHTNAVA